MAYIATGPYGNFDPAQYYGILAGDQNYPGGSGGGTNPFDPSQLQLGEPDTPGQTKKQPVPMYQQPNPTAPPATPPSGSVFDPSQASAQLAGEYSSALGRNARPDEIAQYLPAVQQYGWDAVKNQIDTSPEAKSYGGSSQGLLLDSVLQRLKQLQQPISAPYEDAFAKTALDRVQQLSGAPFTDSQSAALLAKNMGPLTQARDQAKQQAAQDLSRRGFGPTSGVFQDRMKAIDAAYQQGTAGVTNTLNIQGITQAQQNAQQQLQILDSLVQMGRMSRQEADQRSQQIVQTAGIPFQTDQSVLSSLTTAAGGDQSSALLNALLSLGGLNTRGTQIANQNSQDSSQALGAFLSYLLNNTFK